MKILITGMNKNQCTFDYYLKQQLQVVPSHYSLIRCLRDMGHEVDQREVDIGENLDMYDEVILFIHNPKGFAGFVYNALWALHCHPNAILAFDDWQTESIYTGLVELRGNMFRPYIKDAHVRIPENVESFEGIFVSSIDRISAKTNRLLVSAFAGGDISLVLDYPKELIFGYNPNPYHFNRQVSSLNCLDSKDRSFNFAGLVQMKTKRWLKAQEIEKTGWNLKQYGSRKDGQDRVVEGDMVNIYGGQWGILMPGYFHAGSGWWRARPLQVADAGSILIGDPTEMMIYYKDAYLAGIRAIDLVDMTDVQLEELAKAQRDALYENHPLNKETQQIELNSCLVY